MAKRTAGREGLCQGQFVLLLLLLLLLLVARAANSTHSCDTSSYRCGCASG
jgi:hypothetical protein